MATLTLTITIPDAQALRFRTALGKRLNVDGSLATVAQTQNFFIDYGKEFTINYETTIDADNNRKTKSAETWR